MDRPWWESPSVVLTCAGAILLLSLGIRQSFGLFLLPMSSDMGWSRGTFASAIALQNLVWGLAQPLAGMVADRFGAGRVLAVSGTLFASGLAAMAAAQTGTGLYLSAGVLIGVGLGGCTFGVVMAVVGRGYASHQRSLALGAVGAGGSFGQFIMIPVGQGLIDGFGWQTSLVLLALLASLIVPLSLPLRGLQHAAAEAGRASIHGATTIRTALAEAGSRSGFWLLSLSFAVCGFQTVFIMIHLPAYVIDEGLSATAGVMALAVIGLCNTVGTYLCGYLGGRFSKKRLLAYIFLLRAVAITGYVLLPVTTASTLTLAAIVGFTWLGTVPLTNALVAQIFGVRFLATLFGVAFFWHQLGSFVGAWFGGFMFGQTGSYQVVWVVAIGLSLAAAAMCWQIDERAIGRQPLAGTAT
jgi:MFS family permease